MTEEVELPVPYRLVALDNVDSTNAEARRLAEAGAEDGTVVWARTQNAGRGRRGRAWVSEPGNVYCTILIRRDIPAEKAGHFSLLTGLAIADTLAAIVPPSTDVRCKWPNDVLIERRKVAGVLLEAAGGAGKDLDWLAVGAGINVAHCPSDTEFPATSLADERCLDVTVEAVLTSFVLRFAAWRAARRKLGFAPVRAAWRRRAIGIGETVVVRLADETVEGTFADIDGNGTLILETGGQRRHITAGDVFFAGA